MTKRDVRRRQEKLVSHSPSARDLQAFQVLPTSQVGYDAVKPMESVVYCFYEETFKFSIS